MSARQTQVTFDAHDPGALADFWCVALGYRLPDPPGAHTTWDEFLAAAGVPEGERNNASAAEDPDGVGPRLFFQKVADPKLAKNKVHLDVRAAPGLEGDQRMAALEDACAELVALGATRVSRSEPAPPMSHGFIVMQDPEGNEFCLD